MAAPKPTHFEPSELGTKQYWDTTYTSDLSTHASTPNHIGQTWFEDVNASQKILKYLTSAQVGLDRETTTFLDLGTGNGEMLFLLRENGGFKGRVVGVDYSPASIHLCRQIAMKKGYALGPSLRGGMEFTQWDIMNMAPPPQWIEGWDVVLDKGTFDAVSLSAETDGQGRRVCEGYREKAEGLVKKGGLLLVTSCNWTEEELKGWFGGRELEVVGRVEYPAFKFGGMTGQSVCSVCFRKKN